jgi:hypothetical protein
VKHTCEKARKFKSSLKPSGLTTGLTTAMPSAETSMKQSVAKLNYISTFDLINQIDAAKKYED